MNDKKLRCALAYRLDAKTVILAKYDHASQYESHGGAVDETALYGGKDKSYAEAVAKVIENDPPSGLAESGQIGGFKVVQSDQHQVVYGADADKVCKFIHSSRFIESARSDFLSTIFRPLNRFGGYYWSWISFTYCYSNASGIIQSICRKI